MLKINSVVMYGSSGICRVADIRKEKIGGIEREYYILKPAYDENSTVYVPVDSDDLHKKIKKVLSPEEIYELIKNMPDEESDWIVNYKERCEKYKEILDNGDRYELIKMIISIHLRSEYLSESGRKLGNADRTAMKRAEKLLHEEFALVLNIEPDEVIPFIMKQIEPSEKKSS